MKGIKNMKTIRTAETMEKYLLQGYYVKYTQKYGADKGILVAPNGKDFALLENCQFAFQGGIKYWTEIYKRIKNGEDNIIVKEFKGLELKLAKQKEKEEKKQVKAELKWAIEYFNGKALEEGDNITITAEFLDSLEVLLENAKRK
jgi:hypothetical protein